MCERVHCHSGETSCFSSTCLDVCTECPPSAFSKPHSKTYHWWFDQGVWIACGQWLGCWKNDQHRLDIAANLTRFFWPRWIWQLPLWRLLLSPWVITIHPCFIVGYDIGDEDGLLFEFPADRNAKGLLVVAQHSWHKSRRNASHVQIVCQNALNGPVWQSYYLTNIVDSLPMICKDSFANFCNVSSVVLVNGCPECWSLSTDVHPSLKHLYHKKDFLWLMALYPKTSCSIRWVSAAVFFKTETKFDADSLLLKIGHISCKKNSPDYWNITSQNRTEFNNTSSQLHNCWHTDSQSIPLATLSGRKAYDNQFGHPV